MKNMVLKYGGIIMFYLTIVGGVFLVNYRFSKVNHKVYSDVTYLENKWFFIIIII